MKNHLFPAIKLTLLSMVLLTLVYPAFIWAIGLFSINGGKGDLENIGQKFTEDRYFWSRPSAVDYNAAGSAGSNKGPSNPDYLALVQSRKDSFLIHNPTVKSNEIPVDIITASGSGLDPNISPQAARIQIARIAQIRKLNEEKLQTLVKEYTEFPTFGFFGIEKINVLKLNTALDKLSK